MGVRRSVGIVLAAAALLGSAAAASAQTALSGSIAGEVRDTTGALLPGVTVEAASPALIEKSRSAVTDSQGRYLIVELRPGRYTVTFTLSGFNTIRREGIELTAGFTANVGVEMQVGALEETITVTGASPIVDTQNVRTQNVFSRELLDVLPTGKSVVALGALTLGSTPQGSGNFSGHDVAGNKGENTKALNIHGIVGNQRTRWDGTPINDLIGSGGRQYYINTAAVQEIVLDTGGISAESEAGGANMNIVPREGGNRFAVYSLINWTGEELQNTNLNAGLRNRGVNVNPPINQIYDYGFGVGGPVKTDKLWFYTAHRWWGFDTGLAGNFFNATQNTLFYTPDLSRPAKANETQRDHNTRVTWQAAEKHKINLTYSYEQNCRCYFQSGTFRAPEAAVAYLQHPIMYLGSWTYPATNRFLFEGATMFLHYRMRQARPPETGLDTIQVTELSTGYTYGSQLMNLVPGYTDYGTASHSPLIGRVSGSYVTGSHAFKVGTEIMYGFGSVQANPNRNVAYQFRNRIPVSLTQVAAPYATEYRIKPQLGIYAQDQWVIRRMTLNLGVRFDYFNVFIPAQTRPGGEFVGPIAFDSVNGVPNWKDITPRLGIAYDLFGNGKTAVKASLGKFVTPEAGGLGLAVTPSANVVSSTNRNWNDSFYGAGDPRSGNYVPDCDLRSRVTNGECGAMANQAFGTQLIRTRYSDEVMKGWGVRPYIWQGSLALQQELFPGTGLLVAYYRTTYGNFRVLDNLEVTPNDYDPFCVTAPADARLPGGGGSQVCGLYDLKRSVFGRVNNLFVQASDFGDRVQTYDGVDITVNARFGQGGLFSGGLNTGQTVNDQCFAIDSPQQASASQFCRIVEPWAGQTQVKFSGSYPLPWDAQVSAVFQNLPGVPHGTTTATAAPRVYTNAEIAPSLGRNLSACPADTGACTATVAVALFPPHTRREDRLNQLDLRFIKRVRVGGVRLQGMLDIYNIFNANTVLLVNNNYGSQWLLPQEVLPARLFKVGLQIDF
jgi:hypothetical protein